MFRNFAIMLSKFPFEIVEEIFLYLTNNDLVEAMKINRYIWNIVHSNKSLFKYRLPKYSPAAVVVQLTDRIGQVQIYHYEQQVSLKTYLKSSHDAFAQNPSNIYVFQCYFDFDHLPKFAHFEYFYQNVSIFMVVMQQQFQSYVRKFTIKVRRLKKLNYGKGYEYDSETTTTINFIIKCCDKHFSGDEYIDSKNVPPPEELVKMQGQPTKPSKYFDLQAIQYLPSLKSSFI